MRLHAGETFRHAQPTRLAAEAPPKGRPMTALRSPPKPATRATGILPAQALLRAVEAGQIASRAPIDDPQVQPASLDLRLGEVAYRVRASFLPGPHASVEDKIDLASVSLEELLPAGEAKEQVHQRVDAA